MKDVVFITGNQDKADYLARLLGIKIDHQKLDLDEIQSVQLRQVVEHKVRQAYKIVGRPVLVEDTCLEFTALRGLPGPFIKFFIERTGLKNLCRMLDSFEDRSATARCAYAYYDGKKLEVFEGSFEGEISDTPRGTTGFSFGWDRIFIPLGYGDRTRAELTQAEYDKLYLKIKPIAAVEKFLSSN